MLVTGTELRSILAVRATTHQDLLSKLDPSLRSSLTIINLLANVSAGISVEENSDSVTLSGQWLSWRVANFFTTRGLWLTVLTLPWPARRDLLVVEGR
jgi:hypothetical protein